MLDHIKRLFFPEMPPAKPERHDKHELHLAAAALLVEAALMDAAMDANERARIEDLLRMRFELDAGEARDLIEEAEKAAAESHDWHGFTRAIKDGFDHDERIELIEMLWEVAYTDGRLHDFEASLLRRIGGLLYVSDRERGEARRRVLERLGIPDDPAGFSPVPRV